MRLQTVLLIASISHNHSHKWQKVKFIIPKKSKTKNRCFWKYYIHPTFSIERDNIHVSTRINKFQLCFATLLASTDWYPSTIMSRNFKRSRGVNLLLHQTWLRSKPKFWKHTHKPTANYTHWVSHQNSKTGMAEVTYVDPWKLRTEFFLQWIVYISVDWAV